MPVATQWDCLNTRLRRWLLFSRVNRMRARSGLLPLRPSFYASLLASGSGELAHAATVDPLPTASSEAVSAPSHPNADALDVSILASPSTAAFEALRTPHLAGASGARVHSDSESAALLRRKRRRSEGGVGVESGHEPACSAKSGDATQPEHDDDASSSTMF